MDPKVRDENITRMCREGCEVGQKLLKYVRDLKVNDVEFKKLEKSQWLKYVQKNKDFEPFLNTYPIVSIYIIQEDIFVERCFRRYVKLAYGADKTEAEVQYLMENPRNRYYYKNRQYAHYAKFLMAETNPQCGAAALDAVYNSMLEQLDATTDQHFKIYDESVKQIELDDQILNDEKKRELLQLLQRKK